MANKRARPEDIIMKLRQVEVLMGQGMSRLDAIRQIGIVQQTYYRWCKQVTLNTYDVISIDFLAQSSVQLFAHISNCKSRNIRELLGNHSKVVLVTELVF